MTRNNHSGAAGRPVHSTGTRKVRALACVIVVAMAFASTSASGAVSTQRYGSGTFVVQATDRDYMPHEQNPQLPNLWLEWTQRDNGVEFVWRDSRENWMADFRVYPRGSSARGSSSRYAGCGGNGIGGEHRCFVLAEPGSAITLEWLSAQFADWHPVTGCEQVYSDEGGWQNICDTIMTSERISYSNQTIHTASPDATVFAVEPSPVRTASTVPADQRVVVSWVLDASQAARVTKTTVTAQPGGSTCETASGTSCELTGLVNQRSYQLTIETLLADGYSAPFEVPGTVTPLISGLQAWPQSRLVPQGGTAIINVGNVPAFASVTVRGPSSAVVVADRAGLGHAEFTMTKPGAWTFRVKYAFRAGRKLVSSECTTMVYVPRFLSPILRIKAGKSGSVKVASAPPGSEVELRLSDGRVLRSEADYSGWATISADFSVRGAVTFEVLVGGHSIGSGGLTVY